MSSHTTTLDVCKAVAGFPSRSTTEFIRDITALFPLLTPRASVEEREQFMHYLSRQQLTLLPGLSQALAVAESRVAGFSFFDTVLPKICAAVRDIPFWFPDGATLSTLTKQAPGTVVLKKGQAFALLCASFFDRLPYVPERTFGNVRWLDLMHQSHIVGVHRLACLLCYFHAFVYAPCSNQHASDDLESAAALFAELGSPCVVFERISLDETQLPDIFSYNSAGGQRLLPQTSALKQNVNITAETRIEDVASADAIVDFANKHVHIGTIIPSATQEEVLFSVIPEAMLAVLLFEELDRNEVGLVHNADRFSRYTGYGGSFRFDAHYDGPTTPPPTIIIMDAIVNTNAIEFSERGFMRDVYKAYGGFLTIRKLQPPSDCSSPQAAAPVIATGGWGCGIFRGDQTLKFLQQLIAAALTGSRLVYCTFGNEELRQSLEAIAYRCASRGVTVSDVCGWVVRFREMQEPDCTPDFEHFVLLQLS